MELVKNSLLLLNEIKWDSPFPMGVFGTLRRGGGNTHRMHHGKVSAERKAFLPHFFATGLSIRFNHGCSAPFEVFFYDKREWDKMIPGVDALEGFSPSRTRWPGYHRTLAWLRLLPEDYSHEMYDRINLGVLRDLKIPQDEWDKYEKIPCWVYSSVRENEKAKEVDTVIWY